MKSSCSFLIAIGLTEVWAGSHLQTATPTFNPGCPAPCTLCDSQFALAKCLREAMRSEKCTAATVGVTYFFDPDVDCSVDEGTVWDKMSLETASDDLSTAGSLDKVLFNYAMFRYETSAPEDTADIALNAMARSEDCLGERTKLAVEAKLHPESKELTFYPSVGYPLPLDLQHVDLLVTSNGSVTEPYFLGVLDLQAVYHLKPYLSEASVIFDEADCKIADCEKLTDLQSVLHCLSLATSDERCKTATYSRSYKAVGSAPCDAGTPGRFAISLEPIYIEEEALRNEDKMVTITDVSFGEKTSTPDECGKGRVVLATDCFAEGIPTGLRQVDTDGLTFSGEQQLDITGPTLNLIASYSRDCDLEWDDQQGDMLAAKTILKIHHTHPTRQSTQGWWPLW